MRWLSFILPLLLTATDGAGAEVRATLPLQGYYRPGMHMPVRLDGATGPDGLVEVTANGAVTTQIRMSEGEIHGILPLLAAGSIDDLRINGAKVDATLRPVPDGTRLVGNALLTTRPATSPSAQSVIVALDPLDLISAGPGAWEALDELAVEIATAERLGYDQLLALLGLGVDVVVPGEAQPDVALPWRREANGWALRYEPVGPRGSVFPSVMLPVAGWEPGLPDRTRRQTLLAGVVFAILATAVAMWRPRRVVLAAAVLVTLSMVAIAALQARQPTQQAMNGTIVIQSGPFVQHDEWQYTVAAREQELRPLLGRRIVESPAELLAQATPRGYRVPRGGRVAILSRRLWTARMAPAVGRVEADLTSSFAPLVRAGYLRPGVSVVGQVTQASSPTIVLRAEQQ